MQLFLKYPLPADPFLTDVKFRLMKIEQFVLVTMGSMVKENLEVEIL
jgi:hypothetical protein